MPSLDIHDTRSNTSVANGSLPLFRFDGLDHPSVAHGISTREGGVSEGPYASLNLGGSVGDEPWRVDENRRRLAESMGFQGLVTTPQVHGVQVLVVDRSNAEQALSIRADILMTRQPGLLLMQRFADCVPLLFWHESAGAVAVAHAGWRGTALGVAGAAVSALQEHAGANPEGARAAIGPSIGPCCFEVGTEVVERFSDADGAVSQGSRGRPHVNLWELNRRALVAAGVPGDRIEVAGVCTRCQSDIFFSHRAMGYPAGRFGAAIGLRAHHE